jgi:phenylalanyl-tRNA synthetase beta chain
MKISYNTLKQFIDFKHSPEEMGKVLTGTGLEVESIEKVDAVKGGLEGLVVGKVISCVKHPDADKLSLTTVNIGSEEALNIVCGAPNVAVDQKVIVATVGTTLYPTEGEPFTIKKSKIRGAESNGMLCAEDEIGLGKSHAGLLILDPNLEVGQPVAPLFKLEPDYCIEIGLTPNRADAASHYGVARDIKAALNLDLKLPSIENFSLGKVQKTISVEVKEPELCARFCGLEIKNVEVKASPEWLQRFLRTLGLNPINNLVDISNYICHFYGQPMHMFDADQINGQKIIVRKTKAGEKVVTLDGIERTFSGSELAICHETEPMAIAGVFGGKASGVTENTKNIFMEVAYFNPASIRKTSSKFGLKTDASFRFERGTDPNMPPHAIRAAALLVQELAGGEIVSDLIDTNPEGNIGLTLVVKLKNINRLIGKTIELDLICHILSQLDFEVLNKTDEALTLVVPPYRVDVSREADVIEEILRIYGFDNVELSEHLDSDFFASFPVKEPEQTWFRLSERLAAKGFSEIQTLSIVNPADNQWSETEQKTIKLLNPLSEELSEMRRSLLFSGLSSLKYNINRRAKDLKMFEYGRTYENTNTENGIKPKEQKVLSVFMTGNKNAESWQLKSEPVDFYDLGAVVHNILDLMRVKPQESCELEGGGFAYGIEKKLNQKTIVKYGKLSQKVLKYADIKQDVFYAEFNWDLLFKSSTVEHKFIEIPKYPEVRRDLSLVVDKSVNFAQIEKIARQNEKKLLHQMNVFDIYEGEKLGENKKSYSVSFILQDPEKTLVDSTIDKCMERLIMAFENEISALIRK